MDKWDLSPTELHVDGWMLNLTGPMWVPADEQDGLIVHLVVVLTKMTRES